MSIPGFPQIQFPSDFKAAVEQLQESAVGTDNSVRQCAAIDQGTRASWGDFYIGLLDFTKANANPGVLDMVGSLLQRLNSYQLQLYAWQTKLCGAPAKPATDSTPATPAVLGLCQCTLPPLPPAPPRQPSPGSQAVDGIVSVLKWATIAGATIGGIYVVGKAIALIPPAAPRRA
jgi:hypothetical protein